VFSFLRPLYELIEPYCGTKSAEYVKSSRGYVRYLAHLDDPDKAQYDRADIVALGGADLVDALRLNHSDNDKYRIIGEITRYCEEAEIVEFSALTKYAMSECNDWLPVIVEKPYFMTQFLASLRYSTRRRISARPNRKAFSTPPNNQKSPMFHGMNEVSTPPSPLII